MNSGFLCSIASVRMVSRILIGSKVEPPGSPVWLPPFNMPCSTSVFESLDVIILMKIFWNISNKTIGRVLLISHSHSIGLGIGNKRACFHFWDVRPVSIHILYNSSSLSLKVLLLFRTISYVIVDTPAALALGHDESVVFNSSRFMWES